MTEQERVEELRGEVDKRLRTEMVTVGIDVDNAKTGQMWAFDSERLSKIILSLKVGNYTIEELIKLAIRASEPDASGLGIISDDQSFPNYITWDFGDRKLVTKIHKDTWASNFRRVIIVEE